MNQLESGVLFDAALIAQVQRGDFSAFEPLIDRHLAHLQTFIALRAPAASLVDEIAHESFVFAFRNLSLFQAGTSFRAWLRGIAWNLLRAEIQRFSREQANQARLAEHQSLAGANNGPHPDLNASNEAEFLEECVQSLPEGMRQLLNLKYREGLSSEEIGRHQKRSLAWVRTVLFRIRQQLKECIDQKIGQSREC